MAHAEIHHYDFKLGQPATKDEYGEELLGYYYELIGDDGKPLTGLMGPYASKAEVEAAANAEWAHR